VSDDIVVHQSEEFPQVLRLLWHLAYPQPALPILESPRRDVQGVCHLLLGQAKPLPSRDDIKTLRRLMDAMSDDISGTEKLFHMAKIDGPISAVERILADNPAHAER
jgi:hypothetical protein